MERMEKRTDFCDVIDKLQRQDRYIEYIEEENKKLKSDLEQFSEAYKRYRDFEKEELADSCYDLERENKKLEEENENLKEWIDIAKGVPYKNQYNEILPRDENGFYKEVKTIC